MKNLMIILFFGATILFSQNVYEIPFASQGNSIELSVLNKSEITIESLNVNVIEPPKWIKFDEKKQVIKNIKGKEEKGAMFSFSIDKKAPVNEEVVLKFRLNGPYGELWNKEILVSASAPDKLELNQNYPNPFNPTTTISYQLPKESKINIKIYDIIGSEVTSLVNEEQSAGYHEIKWNAARYASGMYIYQLAAENKDKNKSFIRKKMLLLK